MRTPNGLTTRLPPFAKGPLGGEVPTFTRAPTLDKSPSFPLLQRGRPRVRAASRSTRLAVRIFYRGGPRA
jgi:hypothetical protein